MDGQPGCRRTGKEGDLIARLDVVVQKFEGRLPGFADPLQVVAVVVEEDNILSFQKRRGSRRPEGGIGNGRFRAGRIRHLKEMLLESSNLLKLPVVVKDKIVFLEVRRW